MPPPKSVIQPAAKPRYGNVFDAWNSSATGHQRAENKAGSSTGWRVSRTTKLANQFKGGPGGGKRTSDLVGAGAKDYDENLKAIVSKEVRERAAWGIGDMVSASQVANPKAEKALTSEEKLNLKRKREDDEKEEARKTKKVERKIFDGLVIYINGSTHPHISDHRLKHVLAENGARVSIHLGRKSVTHVILGKPNGGTSGAGGGLAGGKMQKEISKVGGRGIKYVGVEWYVLHIPFSEFHNTDLSSRVLESLKAGKRLPETSFSNLKVAPKGQTSVYSMFKQTSSVDTQASDSDTGHRG